VEWEFSHFPGKWLHKVRDILPGGHRKREARLEMVREFFHLGEEIRRLEGELEREAASPTSRQGLRALEARLGELRARQRGMGARVEEILEGEISAVLAREGFRSRVGLIFPPVDFAFDRPPRLLIVSPRERIELLKTVLLSPNTTIEEMEALEREVLERLNLSALVESTGGVATYPSVIPSTYSLEETLRTAIHEWLHQFFFFRPLGQNYYSSPDMTTLNETAADMASEELADMVYEAITGRKPVKPEEEVVEEGFNFNREMRITRLRVDELLAQGRVEEAERYMEERRRLFVQNGYYIRKLNQAYFAFHGTYAESPASVSPIYGELRELRQRTGSVGEFIRVVSRFSSYQAFKAYLEKLRG
jgi:hypothetical protein